MLFVNNASVLEMHGILIIVGPSWNLLIILRDCLRLFLSNAIVFEMH